MYRTISPCCLALFALQCSQPVSDTRAADEAAIRKADMNWAKTVNAKQIDAFVGFVLDSAVVLGPNAPITIGKEAIRGMFAAAFAMPGYSCKWQPAKVEVARPGDLGYSRGTYELSINDARGNPITDRGKYATMWKKQADGIWKVALDMFNTDLPAPSSK